MLQQTTSSSGRCNYNEQHTTGGVFGGMHVLNPLKMIPMNELVQKIRNKVYVWLTKIFGRQFSVQDIEDMAQESVTKLLEKYPKRCALNNGVEMQKLVYVIARNEALKRLEKRQKMTIDDISDLESYLFVQEIQIPYDIPWEHIMAHPDFASKPPYPFILGKIIEFEGECTGRDLYEAIIDEYEEKFNDRPKYDNFRKIKSRMGMKLKRILYQLIK